MGLPLRLSLPLRIAAAALVVVGVAAFGYTRLTAGPPRAELRTAAVQRGSITQTVVVSGSINPAASVRLNFKSGGRLAEVLVVPGDRVTSGQVLARLDLTDLQIALDQAKANLLGAQAKYDQVLAGSSPDEIASARQAVENAQRSLDSAQRTAKLDAASAQQSLYKMRTGYFSAKQSYAGNALGLKTDVDGYQATLDDLRAKTATQLTVLAANVTNFTGGPHESTVKSARASVGQADTALQNANSLLGNQLKPALADYATAVDVLLTALASFESAMNGEGEVSATVAPYQAAQSAYAQSASRLQVALDAYSAQMSSAQSGVSSAITTLQGIPSVLDGVRADLTTLQSALLNANQTTSGTKSKLTGAGTALATITEAAAGGYAAQLQSYQQALEKGSGSLVSAQNVLATAQLSLQKTQAPARSFEITAAYASVLASQAQLDAAQSNLANATLKAPADGVVASVNAQPGEFVGGGSSGSGTPFLLLANTSTLALHGTVGEADVAKLKVGQVATVTVDAIGSDKRLTGRVTNLDPVATLQQGVPVYGIDITIDVPDSAIRAGMSGTANVIISSKRDVLLVPNLALRNISGRRGVQVLRDGQSVEVTEVRFGAANDQFTEVLEGLEEGELVVLPTPRASATPAGGIRFGPPGPGGPPGR